MVNNIYSWTRTVKWEVSLRPEQEIRSDVRQPVEGTALDQRRQKVEVKMPRTWERCLCILGFTVYILVQGLGVCHLY